MTRPVAVLVGAPGAGKTTVGLLLARRLGVPFRDSDLDVEAATGETVADIFVGHGEDHFRSLEREAVARALTEHDGVLAVGGGAVLDAGTRALLTGHTVVHLEVGAPEAASRVGMAAARPLLIGSPRASLAALLKKRAPLYAEVATVVVDTHAQTPQEVAATVEEALEAVASR